MTNLHRNYSSVTSQAQAAQVYTLMYVVYKLHNTNKLINNAGVHLLQSDKVVTALGQPHVFVIQGDISIAVHFIFILSVTDFTKQFMQQHIGAGTCNDLIIIRVVSQQHVLPIQQFIAIIISQQLKATGKAPQCLVYVNTKPIDKLQLQQAEQYHYTNMLKLGNKATSLYYTNKLKRGSFAITQQIVQAILIEYLTLVETI